MTSTLYISEAVAAVDTVTGDAKLVSVAMNVYDAYTGGSLVTDLTDVIGSPIAQVTPEPTSGYQGIFKSTGHSGTLYLEDPDGARHPVQPADLGSRVGGVSSVTQDGGSAQTGAVSVTSPTWGTIAGKPAVIAAGTDAAAARTAISAVGTADKNQPNGVAGLDAGGLLDPAVFASSIDLSGYAEITDLGIQIEAIPTGDDSNLAAALASVSSTLGVNGFIAVKVAGS